LPAADPRGTGVAKTYLTVNGPAPTTSSPAYQAPFVLRHSAKIRYFSVDNAGNAERVRTITIKIG
jgi:hypothetical protein